MRAVGKGAKGEQVSLALSISYGVDGKKERRGNSFFEWLVKKFYKLPASAECRKVNQFCAAFRDFAFSASFTAADPFRVIRGKDGNDAFDVSCIYASLTEIVWRKK